MLSLDVFRESYYANVVSRGSVFEIFQFHFQLFVVFRQCRWVPLFLVLSVRHPMLFPTVEWTRDVHG